MNQCLYVRCVGIWLLCICIIVCVCFYIYGYKCSNQLFSCYSNCVRFLMIRNSCFVCVQLSRTRIVLEFFRPFWISDFKLVSKNSHWQLKVSAWNNWWQSSIQSTQHHEHWVTSAHKLKRKKKILWKKEKTLDYFVNDDEQPYLLKKLSSTMKINESTQLNEFLGNDHYKWQPFS